jgi:hypothetical protein
MKLIAVTTLCAVSTAMSAWADFSYTTVRKTTGGSMAAMAGASGNETSKYSFKGQKMKVDTGNTSTILDFDSQTITTINNAQKTYTVRGFNDIPASQNDVSAKIDVKETGQKKTVNGYNASQLVLTMDVTMPQAGPMGKMQMEVDMWISKDAPGASELRKFYQKNMAKFPWAAMGGGGNQAMAASMADLQRKIADMDGVPVEEIIKLRAAGGAAAPQMPQMTAEQSAQMAQAMAKLQELQKQGGPAAAAAAQAMARMGGAQGAAGGRGAAGASNSMIEMTIDTNSFSTDSVAESTFAVPGGFAKQ